MKKNQIEIPDESIANESFPGKNAPNPSSYVVKDQDYKAPQPKQTDDTVSLESDRSIKLLAFQEAASAMQLFTQRSVRFDSGFSENQTQSKSFLKSTRSSRR